MTETGWVEDIFYDFMKDSSYNLEDNLPYLAEVIALEAERLCHEEIKKILKILEKQENIKELDWNKAIGSDKE